MRGRALRHGPIRGTLTFSPDSPWHFWYQRLMLGQDPASPGCQWPLSDVVTSTWPRLRMTFQSCNVTNVRVWGLDQWVVSTWPMSTRHQQVSSNHNIPVCYPCCKNRIQSLTVTLCLDCRSILSWEWGVRSEDQGAETLTSDHCGNVNCQPVVSQPEAAPMSEHLCTLQAAISNI